MILPKRFALVIYSSHYYRIRSQYKIFPVQFHSKYQRISYIFVYLQFIDYLIWDVSLYVRNSSDSFNPISTLVFNIVSFYDMLERSRSTSIASGIEI
jgi:hypothetical protein